MEFAKIYERDGRQVLIFKDNNDEGEPVVKMHVNSGGLWVTQAFHPNETATIDGMYDVFDEETAFEILDGIDERIAKFAN